MNEFFTWETLATMAGATLGTSVITQFVKAYIPVPTQLVSYVLAAAILLAATFFTGGLTMSGAAIIPLNAVLVSVAANGAFSAVKRVKAVGSNGRNKKN